MDKVELAVDVDDDVQPDDDTGENVGNPRAAGLRLSCENQLRMAGGDARPASAKPCGEVGVRRSSNPSMPKIKNKNKKIVFIF